AANIGAGSTVGATALGYTYGISAVWWVGCAGLGSIVLAFWIGPSMRRVAEAHRLRTVGDFLEHRYDVSVRSVAAGVLWLGALFILAGQLWAIGTIISAVTGAPPWLGCAIGGVVITAYFAAGGLLTAAWVNVVQLAVKMIGFALALPLAVLISGGMSRLHTLQPVDDYWQFWRAGSPGLATLAIIVPPFIVSPGLLQKIFGARDDRAVRIGVGFNALGLLIFAAVPALLGIAARSQFPSLGSPDAALPTLLVRSLPPLVGAVGVAAVFSAEISASDAILFMLTTSLAQDFYKRFVDPTASDARMLRLARGTAVVSGAVGIALAVALGSVVNALTIFYTLIGVSLFVPVLAGLYVPRTAPAGALATMIAGVAAALVVHVATGGRGWGVVTPAVAGLAAAVAAWVITLAFPSNRATYVGRSV
ncbi:MAG TPA: sodium:solute symporter family protein, partial [Vicinamibacterales bacterium]|nr:sodium:solute symporter family protein [Vicinamibacterales bacterium]